STHSGLDQSRWDCSLAAGRWCPVARCRQYPQLATALSSRRSRRTMRPFPLTADAQRDHKTIAVVNQHVIAGKVDGRSRVSWKISAEDFGTVTGAKHVHRIADLPDVQRGRDTHRDEIA